MSLEAINNIEIPRFLGTVQYGHISLNGFPDASSKTYGAVVYLLQIKRKKCFDKYRGSKKSANKNTTILRLELNTAVSMVKFMETVIQSLNSFYCVGF